MRCCQSISLWAADIHQVPALQTCAETGVWPFPQVNKKHTDESHGLYKLTKCQFTTTVVNIRHSWSQFLWRFWACFYFCTAPGSGLGLYSFLGWGHPLQVKAEMKLSLIISDKNLHLRVSNSISPFTANFIIIPNFMNILALASSLGPLICFTFDHLLCPAHKAGHSCRVLAGLVLQGRLHTREAGRKSSSARKGSERDPACRARRAPSTAAGPAMPFTPRQIISNLLYRRSKKLIQETAVNLPLFTKQSL